MMMKFERKKNPTCGADLYTLVTTAEDGVEIEFWFDDETNALIYIYVDGYEFEADAKTLTGIYVKIDNEIINLEALCECAFHAWGK